jgi:hypothetical protein
MDSPVKDRFPIRCVKDASPSTPDSDLYLLKSWKNISFLSRFQVVFDRLRINQYSIDWSEVIDKKDLSKSLPFLTAIIPTFLLSQ